MSLERGENRRPSDRFRETKFDWASFLLPAAFVTWCLGYIAKTSFVAIDGQRYFTLLDDALISLRYAWNLTHGDGLQWNQGGDVEGYTNLLQVLLMSLATLIPSRRLAVLGVRVEGVVVMVLLGYLCGKLADYLLADTTLSSKCRRMIGFVCGVSCYPVTSMTLEGMETGLLAVLWVGALLSLFTGALTRERLRVAGILLGLSFAARPDGLILVPFAAAYVFLRTTFDNGFSTLWKPLQQLAMPILAVVATVTVLRYSLYDAVVPNTYTLKVEGIPVTNRLKNGLVATIPYLSIAGPLFAVVLVDQVVRPNLERVTCFLFALALVAYMVWAGGDTFTHLGNYWRLPGPGSILLLILSVSAMSALARLKVQSSSRYFPFWVGIMLLLAIFSINRTSLAEITLQDGLPIGDAEGLTNSSLVLKELLRPEAKVAVTHAGTVPYYTGLFAIDILGKNDKHVAKSPPRFRTYGSYTPGHNKVDIKYSLIDLAADVSETIAVSGDNLDSIVPLHDFAPFSIGEHRFWFNRASTAVRWEDSRLASP